MTDQSGGNLNQVYHAIGALTAEVAGLRRDIQQAESRATETAKQASDHRANMHRRVDDMVDVVGEVKADLASLKKDVADAKEVTDDVRRWKLMGIGALGVTGIAAGAISSAITYFWSDILRMLTR